MSYEESLLEFLKLKPPRQKRHEKRGSRERSSLWRTELVADLKGQREDRKERVKDAKSRKE